MTYDYIVIGAGSAGCVLANRLSENAKVLVLEAGGPDDEQNIHIPAAFPQLFRTVFDYAYMTEPQVHCNGRQDFCPRGKVLGGCSSMNAMIYQRGAPANYDRWAALGNDGWSYKEVLPFFLKSQNQERTELIGGGVHGSGGPVNVTDLRDPNPLSLAMVQAAQEQGYQVNRDFNSGKTQEGFGLYQVTQKNGMRHSGATAYLHPAMTRENLTVVTYAQVQRLTFKGKTCTGAIYTKDGETHVDVADKEVIVSAGAINSPQLLMLSGIGPLQELLKLGIAPVVDLPGVGQNLQDHYMAPVSYHCKLPVTLANATDPKETKLFREEGKGMLTSNIAEAGGFLTIKDVAEAPDLQFHFAPSYFVAQGAGIPEGHGFTLLPGIVGTKSRGSVTLRSSDPDDPPKIDPNFLEEEHDLEVIVEGIKVARNILQSAAFDDYRGDEFLPGPNVQSDADIKEFIRNNGQTLYHPVGTCKMGNDPMAVVNSHLQVHGVSGLRVADASIFPFIVNANTNNPCFMVGERCADFILKGI